MEWDYTKGNLSKRSDIRKGKEETFGYDNLDRLTSANISGVISFSASYASNGNITSKTDAGNYSYHGTKFNAVTGATNPNNVVPSIQQDISYTAFQQPSAVTEGNFNLTYTYGADYNRIKSELKENGTTIRTRYYFSEFEKDDTGRFIHYVNSPVGLIAIVENNNTHYTYTDHLGSIVAVTNGSGNIEVEMNFDAWGRRRDPNSWALLAPTASTGLPDWLYRGYTGHEHLDQFGLINMNGRLYDPVLGRMLSPDNYVQEPGMTQSFNRYTYAMNNPLVYTDPDGNFWNFVIGAAIGGFSGYQIGKASGAKGWGLLGYTLAGAGIGAFTSGLGEAVVGSFSAAAQVSATVGVYATAGAVSGAVSGASFAALAGGGASEIGKASLFGGVIGGATGAIGGYLKHQSLENSLKASNNHTAFCDECKSVYKGKGGNLLRHATAKGSYTPISNFDPYTAAFGVSGVLLADDLSGVGVVDDIAIPVAFAGALAYDLTQRTYITYTLQGPGGATYIGRASGFGDPQSIMRNRYAGHHMRQFGYGNPTLDRAAYGFPNGYSAIRGREQQMIDFFGGVGSPNVGNRIRAVAAANPFGRTYHSAANIFGNIAPYTGY